MLNRILCLVAAFLFCQTLTAADPSWTVFHGVSRDNVSPETGLLKSWGENGPKLVWRTEGIGNTEFPGYSSVTIADGRIFTSGNIRVGDSDQAANAFVFALDAKTGKEIWRYDNGTGWTIKAKFPGERSTPTIDGDRVYVYSAAGRLACLDAETGKEIWVRNLQEEYAAQLPTWALAESVVVDGNQVVCWIGGTKAAVAALDKLTGKTIWETPGTGHIGAYASMNIIEQDGLKIYLNLDQKGLLAVNAKTGEKLFHFLHESDYDILVTTPYYFDGKILISTANKSKVGTKLLKLSVSGNKASVEELWTQSKLDNFHGGIIVKDGYVYGTSHNYKKGIWICLKLADGSIVWEDRGVGEGSVSYAEELLYCMSETEGNVAIVRATPAGYQEISRFTLPEEGSGKYWAHPVICGKKLYLRHAGFLYCYDIAE